MLAWTEEKTEEIAHILLIFNFFTFLYNPYIVLLLFYIRSIYGSS